MDSIPQKRCTKCKQFHPATKDYFHADKTRSDGLFLWCKQCRYTYNKVPPEKNRITQRKYDASHSKDQKQYQKQYHKTDTFKAMIRNSNARRHSVAGKHTAQQIRDQYSRQKGKCYYCSQSVKWKEHHIDHTFPLSRMAGTDIPANAIDYLVISCSSCNLKKHNKFPWEFPEGGRLL